MSFISLFMRDNREREAETQAEGEADSLLSAEPNTGLSSRTLRPRPESMPDS